MAKQLEMQFVTEIGQTTITLEAPKEPIDPVAVKAAMDEVVASEAFYSAKGKLVAVKGARLIDRNVTEYEI
ncbi:DUF2922 domain-containing protein [Robertmurraya kyonggiensis]|uniref:DUF2922 domain-containing protein n=1 Tax=Robertmurraya kyonggiensis TaxID=1037680 RepID=A0A4V5P1M6_9BACI|nr:DUF2922 domain-containing protein [Robertmurraya kyonggiensis]TKC18780.1 DUF2922 domain-containing protein [Robertmurraya kyonggiensis]